MSAYSKPGFAARANLAAVSDDVSTRVRLLVVLLLTYLWWYLATPYVRFEVLSEIRFERILVVLVSLGILARGTLASRASPFNFLIPLFYGWMFLSFLLSPYSDIDAAQYWRSEYWKIVVLYFFVSFGIRDRNDLFVFMIGIALISFTYQFYSLLDFMRGGSYVFQQGMRRMVGVWSGGGLGAANAWGMMALFTVPFAVFGLRASRSAKIRLVMAATLVCSTLSIVFSGTRGAMVGLVLLLFAYGGFRLIKPTYLLGAILALAVGISLMPDEYRHRYSLILVDDDSDVVQTRDDVIASGSAHSRIEGLVDGFNMAMLRPISGMGPGASPIARLEVRDDAPLAEGDAGFLQLHNLYGQVMGELGFVGFLIFLSMIAVYFVKLSSIRADGDGEDAIWRHFRKAVAMAMVVMVVYGMFTHSLYRFHWMLLFACHNVLMNIAPRVEAKTLSGRKVA